MIEISWVVHQLNQHNIVNQIVNNIKTIDTYPFCKSITNKFFNFFLEYLVMIVVAYDIIILKP